MKKHALIAFVICISLTVVAIGVMKALPRSSWQGGTAGDAKTLREKAKRAGHVTATANPKNLQRYDAIATLKRDSASIVIGSVSSQTSSLLPPKETMIVTDYKVTVLSVLKGGGQPGQTVTVRTPGGRVQFDDGSSAEVSLPTGWNALVAGKTYVMFLDSRPAGHFVLTGGPQGLFEVTSGGSVVPQGRVEDKLMQANNGKSKDAFIAEVLNAPVQK